MRLQAPAHLSSPYRWLDRTEYPLDDKEAASLLFWLMITERKQRYVTTIDSKLLSPVDREKYSLSFALVDRLSPSRRTPCFDRSIRNTLGYLWWNWTNRYPIIVLLNSHICKWTDREGTELIGTYIALILKSLFGDGSKVVFIRFGIVFIRICAIVPTFHKPHNKLLGSSLCENVWRTVPRMDPLLGFFFTESNHINNVLFSEELISRRYQNG